LQLTALQRAGYTRIFTDKATGVHVKRPQLTKCLTTLQADDVLTVWKLDRLGRSLRGLINLSLNLSQFVEDQNDPAIGQNHPS
jgi:DNA invertase Pin-like site-specific DNA recombinase